MSPDEVRRTSEHARGSIQRTWTPRCEEPPDLCPCVECQARRGQLQIPSIEEKEDES